MRAEDNRGGQSTLKAENTTDGPTATWGRVFDSCLEQFFSSKSHLARLRSCDCDIDRVKARDKVLIMLLCKRGFNIKAYG